MVAAYPAHLNVQGAEIALDNPEAEEIIWKWRRVEPTDLRLNRRYAKVL